jgi:hypothetical protein
MYILEVKVPLSCANWNDKLRIRRAVIKAKNKRSIYLGKPAADAGNPLPLIIMMREAAKKFPHHMERIRRVK